MLMLALIIGIVAGLRAMMAPAVIAWVAATRGLSLEGTWLAFLGWRFTPWVFSLLALGELITDQLPSTLSRKVPVQFGARLVSGGVSGMAFGYAAAAPLTGLALGITGAVIGTYVGSAARAWLAVTFGRDRPAALIEDAVAVTLAAFVFHSL